MTSIVNNQNLPETYSLLLVTQFKRDALRWATSTTNPESTLVVTFNRGAHQNVSLINQQQVNIETQDDLRDLNKFFRTPEAIGITTVVFDGLDDFIVLLMNERLAETSKEEFVYADWNWLSSMVKKVIQAFTGKGRNFIATSGLNTTGEVSKPGLPGSSAHEVPKILTYTLLFDHVPATAAIEQGEVSVNFDDQELEFYIRSGPSIFAPWITDYTEALDLNFFGSADALTEAYKSYCEWRSGIVESKPEIALGTPTGAPQSKPEIKNESTPTQAPPGMSDEAEIASLLNGGQ